MKVLNIENKSFRVFDSDLSIDEKLPAGVYTILFDSNSGYALSKRPNLLRALHAQHGCHLLW